MNNPFKVAVTGAGGQIGYSLVFRIAAGEMFGKDTQVDLRLIDLPRSLAIMEGVKMELDDCAFPLLKNITVTTDLAEGFDDLDWAILVGSVPRKDGMERKDLLNINGQIFVGQGKALSDHAKPDVKVLVVGNPCNTNAMIARRNAPKIPKTNFFAMTALDENRAKYQLSAKAGRPVSSVTNLAIWGNHSSTQFPDYFHAKISGIPVPEVTPEKTWLQTLFLETIQQRGAEIIKARGASSAASAANAIIDSVRNVITPTPDGDFFSLAIRSDGSYGVPEGLIFSYPVRSDGKKLSIVQNIVHDEFAAEKLRLTINELEEEREAVKHLLG